MHICAFCAGPARAEEVVSISHRPDLRLGKSNAGAFVPMEADDSGAREAAAAEYNRRIVERAAGVLTAEQLVVYQQMIDTAVEQERSFRALPQAAIREVTTN